MTATTPSDPCAARSESLKTVLIAVFVICIGLPAIVSGTYFVWSNYERTVEKDSMSSAAGYADFLQAGLAVALWNLAPDLAEPLVDSVMVDKSVLAVRVVDDEDNSFLHRQRSEGGGAEQDAVTLTRSIVYQEMNLGYVELVYSFSQAQSRAASETKMLMIIVAAQLLFSLVPISLILHRRVLSPLQKLSRAASGITKGDLSSSIPKLRNDEFGALSLRLEEMRNALEHNFKNLETRVSERTGQLQEANHTLQGALEQLQTTQDNLIQSEKLAALGALVAGVAHELNTPIGNGLTVSSSMSDACRNIQQQMEQGLTRSALHEYMTDMEEGTRMMCRNLERASELVRGFKQVAVDRTSAQRRTFSLLALLEETRLTLSPTFKRTPYIVDIELAEDVLLDSYPGPLGQVITNLLNNALIHAFDGMDHGRVVIAGQQVRLGVELTVTDDGRGIAQEHQAKIFDPFFTTKLGAGGNGLGMHIVHNIVTGVLGGKISLKSEPGGGAQFILFLPLQAPEDRHDDSDYSEKRPQAVA